MDILSATVLYVVRGTFMLRVFHDGKGSGQGAVGMFCSPVV